MQANQDSYSMSNVRFGGKADINQVIRGPSSVFPHRLYAREGRAEDWLR
jgi:hypothetical protein